MEAAQLATILDWLIKSGIPAGLGVIIVLYLLRYHIPRLETAFSDALKQQLTTFEAANKGLQEAMRQQSNDCKVAMEKLSADHSAAMKQLSDAVSEEAKAAREQRTTEGEATRQALRDLTTSNGELSKAVFKLYGQQRAS